MEPTSQPSDIEKAAPLLQAGPARALCLLLLLAGAGLHTWYLIDHCPIDLSGDEAHYWEWSQRLDWSYYSKGPLVAYVIAAGRALLEVWSVHTVGNESLAVRMPAVLLGILTGLGIFELGVRTLRRPRVALAAVAIICAIPIFAAGSLLMTIDAPLACTWVWALVLVDHAIARNSTAAWIGVGLLTAIGILAKYNMLLLGGVLAPLLLFTPRGRTALASPGPWIAGLLGASGILPIVYWNARHDWVSFRHVAGQAGVAEKPRFDLLGPVQYAVGQLAVVGPVWLIALVLGVTDRTRKLRHSVADADLGRMLLLSACIVPFAVFFVFSFITKIQPNWPLLGLPTGVLLMADWLSERLKSSVARERRNARMIAGLGVITGLAMVVIGHDTRPLLPLFARFTANAPAWELTPIARYDPTARLKGWSTLGAAVGQVLAEERAAGREPFILTDDYQVASLVRFYTPGNPPTYSAQAVLGGRRSQYDIWENPLRDRKFFVGRPVIYIGSNTPEISGRDGRPGALRDPQQARLVEYREGGYRLAVWAIWRSAEYLGFESGAANKY